MAAYPDTFDRADGPLGGDWSVWYGSITISGNAAVGSAFSMAYPTSESEAGDQDHYIVVNVAGGNSWGAGIVLKFDPATGNRYLYEYSVSAGTATCVFYRIVGGSQLEIYRATAAGIPDGPLVCRAVYSGGTLSAFVGGDACGSVADATHAANTRFGMRINSNPAPILSFDAGAPAPIYLSITPENVYTMNLGSYFSVELHGTTWAGPFPTAGTLSVDHGFIITQYGESSTLSSFSYNSLQYVGVVTVTCSETGAQGTFNCRPYPVPENGDSFPLTESGAGILNRTGDECPAGEILTTCHNIEGVTGAKVLEALASLADALGGMAGQTAPSHPIDGIPAKLWRAVNDSGTLGLGPFDPGYDEPLATTLKKLKVSLDDVRTGANYTIETILAYLGGSPTLYSHKDLLDAINAIPATDLSAVLAAIAAVRGDGNPSIASVMAQLAAIRVGGSNYTLGDILDDFGRLTASRTLTLQSILDVLSAYHDIDITWHDSDLHLLTDIQDTCNLIYSDIEEVMGPSRLTLEEVLARLDYQADRVVEEIGKLKGPPIWPGLDNVTLGAPQDLQTTHTLAGPMHGVIIDITSTDPGTGFYDYDTHRAWRNVGALSFFNELGAHEDIQPLGWTKGLYTPKKLTLAAGVRTHLGRGPQGTITPWTIN